MAWTEERAEWAFMMAVVNNSREFYNKLSPEDKIKFDKMKKEIDEIRKKNPNAEFYIPNSYDD